MTVEKLVTLFKYYDWWLESVCSVAAKRHEDPTHWVDIRQHLRWMCQTALDELIPQSRIEKAMRWLGFIQGMMCALRMAPLPNLKEHSMPETDLTVYYLPDS